MDRIEAESLEQQLVWLPLLMRESLMILRSIREDGGDDISDESASDAEKDKEYGNNQSKKNNN